MESMPLLASMVVTLGLNLFGRDLNIFLTTFESRISSPRLKEKLTISLSLENKNKIKNVDFHAFKYSQT